MINRAAHITTLIFRKRTDFMWFRIILLAAFVLLSPAFIHAQVITNEGAAINVIPGTVVVSREAVNSAPGVLSNNGEINLTGNYTSTATTSGNGFFRIGGHWTNTGGFFIPGSSTVIFNGPDDQFITRTGGENFFNLFIQNSGAPLLKSVGITNNVEVLGTLTMSLGNINAGTYILYLSNPLAAALNYTSTTQSRIFGRFEREISQTSTYLFPFGTNDHYNPANLIPNNIISSGSVLSQFITSPPPGDNGLPVPDPPVEIGWAYPGGYWSMTARNNFSAADFSLNLNATGFADTVQSITRIIKRDTGGPWVIDGAHATADTINNIVYRNSLTGNISDSGTEFALGRARPLIIDHPDSLIQCEHTDAVFSVIATGAGRLTYRWYKDGVILTNGDDYSGARTATLTVTDINLVDAGSYWCEVSDRYRNKTVSNIATLIVNKIPVATITPADQPHECSNIAFEDILLGESYGVPGTTYIWTRTEPDGISTTIPVSGADLNIGDILSGSFTNSSDAYITVTFTIIPVGPAPTYCVGLPVEATITVNPTPRALPVNMSKQICYGGTTEIILRSPSVMTRGVIEFDFDVTTTAVPPVLTGNTLSETDRQIEYKIRRSYQNNSDTMHSVYYHIRPKNVISGCNPGEIVIPEVKVHPNPLQDTYVSVPFTCTGGTAGVLTTVLSKVSNPKIIHWIRPWRPDTTYTTTSNVDDLSIHYAGNYLVTVTDSLGCRNSSPIQEISGAVFNSYIQVRETDTGYGTSCPGAADGEIWVWEENTSTAIAPYTFWLVYNGSVTTGPYVLPDKGDANRIVFTSLPSGRYDLLLYDSNGCPNTGYPVAYLADPPSIEVKLKKREYPGGYNISCLNYDDGSVWVDSIGGGNNVTEPYLYYWYTNDGLITGPDNLNVIDSITAGKYYLLTTDIHNCTRLDSITITQPDGLTFTAEVSSSPDNNYQIACAGDETGSVDLTIHGGSGNYIYSWTNGTGTFSATTENINNLPAGVYTATVTDQANTSCILMPQPTFLIEQPDSLLVTAVPSVSADGSFNIDCNGGTGSVLITVEGGSVGNYEYNWSTDDGSGIVPGERDQMSLTSGTYKLVVTDANHCSTTIDVTLSEPPALETTLVPTNITCDPPGFSNGSVDLSVSGGVGPYTFGWQHGPTTEDISGLSEGWYRVIVRDANNCVSVDSARVNLPPPLEYTSKLSLFTGYNVSCYGLSDGSIKITMTSGQEPFIFDWQRADGGFSETTPDISGLQAGQYILTIVDANMCRIIDTFEITQPGRLSMEFELSSSIAGGYNINCAGQPSGSINVIPVNSVGTAHYLWSDGITSKTRSHIPAGDYGIIITDSNNCQADSSVTLTDPDRLSLVFDVTQPWCPDMPDGEIRLTVTGGVVGTDYNYIWSDNSMNRDLTNVPEGLYKVTVSDLNGCILRDSIFLSPQRETCLIIPNAISPNGDLINDVWNIGLIELYPQIEIKVFNRWGEIIWRSEKGYPFPWDGRSNGYLLPMDSYHYIIDLNNGAKPIVGNITVIR